MCESIKVSLGNYVCRQKCLECECHSFCYGDEAQQKLAIIQVMIHCILNFNLFNYVITTSYMYIVYNQDCVHTT